MKSRANDARGNTQDYETREAVDPLSFLLVER